MLAMTDVRASPLGPMVQADMRPKTSPTVFSLSIWPGLANQSCSVIRPSAGRSTPAFMRQ